MTDLVSGGHLRLILQVALNVRLAGILLVFLLTPEGLGPTVALLGLSCLAVSYLTMRHIRAYEERFARSMWFPALDAALTVALVLVTDPGGPAIAYVAATAFVWALVGRRWAVVATVLPVLLLLGVRLAVLLGDDLLRQYWTTLAQVAMLWLTVLAGHRVRRLQEHHVQLQLAARSASIRSAQAEERIRLSMDMHDSVAKSLHGIHLMAEHIERRLTAEQHDLAPQMKLLRQSVAQARGEARSLVRDYRDPIPEDAFVGRLEELVREWAAAHPGFTVTTQLGAMAPGPGAAHEWLAAVGEALENVARHSGGDRVAVSTSQEEGWARVTVLDNGRGMPNADPASLLEAGHFGVDGMRRRMARVGGSLQVEPGPGGGTLVALHGPADLGADAEDPCPTSPAGGPGAEPAPVHHSHSLAQGALP